MIADRLTQREIEHGTERTSRLRWRDGEATLRIRVPRDLAGSPEDASPLLAATLLQAMRRHEDLQIDGLVSPRLLRRSDTLQAAYHAWDLSLRRCAVEVAGVAAPTRRSEAVLCFFSRGVDSLYSATAARSDPGTLSALVFSRGLEPIHDPGVQKEEVRLAREAAALIGLPLTVCSTNVREITDPLMSWGDAHGAGLAFIALTLAGGAGHVVIPSTSGFAALGPHGSSPVLDPLYSTESLDLHHDAVTHGRVGKVAWLAAERPDLLGLLKVCFEENRPDNCGRCGKCLFTMGCLEAAGALGRATGFPDRIDLGAVAAMRHSTLTGRIDWCELWRVLPGGPLREAIHTSLRRTAHPPLRERLRRRARGRPARTAMSMSSDQFDRHWTNTAASLLMDGRPYP